MASQNAGALLTGMTDGVVNMWKFGLQQQRYDREDERQAKRDAREEAESSIRTEAARMELEKAREGFDRKLYFSENEKPFMNGEEVPDFATWRANRTSGKANTTVTNAAAAAPTLPAAPELPALSTPAPTGVPAPAKAGSVPNPFAEAAPSVAPPAAPAAGTPQAGTPQANKPPAPAIGDVITAKGLQQKRTDDDRIKWQINTYRALNLHDDADSLETKWLDLTEKRQAREKAVLLESTYRGITQGGGEWVAQNMGRLFGPDVQLRHEPDGNGGGVITAYKANDPTKPIGTTRYKDKTDLYDMAEQYIDPVAYSQRMAQARAAAVKHQRELQVAAARSGAYYDANGDVVGRIDEFTARGRGGNGGNSSGDGTGTRGGNKPPKSIAEIAMDSYRKAVEAAGQNTPLTADQDAAGQSATVNATQLNPGIAPSIAAHAGILFAQTEPGKTKIRWDANTMTALEGVDTPGGWVAVNRITHRNAINRGMPPEQTRAAVESSIQQVAGNDPVQRQKVIRAAFDTTGKARRELLEFAKAKRMAHPEFKKLTPAQQAQDLANFERHTDGILGASLGWIANFGKDLNK